MPVYPGAFGATPFPKTHAGQAAAVAQKHRAFVYIRGLQSLGLHVQITSFPCNLRGDTIPKESGFNRLQPVLNPAARAVNQCPAKDSLVVGPLFLPQTPGQGLSRINIDQKA
jgi:hypothetical protein